jgi:hypothetical protein
MDTSTEKRRRGFLSFAGSGVGVDPAEISPGRGAAETAVVM